MLTFTTDTFPQGASECGLIWVVLWGIRLVLMIQGGGKGGFEPGNGRCGCRIRRGGLWSMGLETPRRLC